jgi:glycosyltransferase involved in cell wall biosynthesis
LRRLAVSLKLAEEERTVVFGSGSGNGVDWASFASTEDRKRAAQNLRKELSIPNEAPVVGFVGRLTRDKGVVELLEAFHDLRKEFREVRLFLVGQFEGGDALPEHTRQAIQADPHIICPGFAPRMASFYHVMDVLVLPTHREGFPNVVLEAQAAGRPVVATRATGVVDAIMDEVSGLLVPIGDSESLARAIGRILRNDDLAIRLGNAGRERALLEFKREIIWNSLLQEYRHLLGRAGLELPAGRQIQENPPVSGPTFNSPRLQS